MTPSTGLSADQVKFIERCVKGFRQALDRGERPVLDGYLDQTPHEFLKRELLKALLRADWDSQKQKGNKPAVDPYVTQYADLSESVSDAFQQWTRENEDRHATTPPVTPAAAPTASRTPSAASVQKSAPPPNAVCHYLRHGVPIGPFTWDQLTKLARAGDIRPKDQVHVGGTAGWQEAGQVTGLFARSAHSRTMELKPGEVIPPDYMLLELIGRGGMGDVYKVFRISLKREYALKIIRPDRFHILSPQMKQEQLERFQKEMQTTARLKHEHVVVIHDTGEHCGLPFYTMDFIEMNLAQKLRQGPIPARQAAEIMAKAARGVHHAHAEGIIHRDIKPHNILLDKDDKPLVADLGLAAALEVLQRGQGEVAGTAAYMAPEQACGGNIDARTDVYGLGATLYHLVTGRPPHQASERNAVLKQVQSAEALSARHLNPTLDRNLNAIIMKCLEKSPERRYATALALAEDLERYLKGFPVHAKAPSITERVGKWVRREPAKAMLTGAILGLAGLLFAALLVLFVVLGVAKFRLEIELAATKTAQEDAEKSAAEALKQKEAADVQRKAAEDQRNTAQEERKKAAMLAYVLDRRALNKQRFDDDPKRIVDSLQKQTAEEERLLETVRDETTVRGIQAGLADNYRILADAIINTGDPKKNLPKVIDLLEKCVKLQEELGKVQSSFKIDLGLNYIELAGWYYTADQPEKVLFYDEKALKVLEEVRKEINEPPILARIAEANMMLGADYFNKGYKDIALGYQKNAVKILDELVSAPSAVSSHVYEQRLGRACRLLGSNDGIKSHAEAITYLEKAEKIFADKSQYRRNLADVRLSLGIRQTKNDQARQALSSLASADKLADELIKEKPSSKLLANSLQILKGDIASAQAAAYEKNKDFDEAESCHKRSLEIRKSTGDIREYAEGLNLFARFYGDQKRYIDAIPLLDEAIPLQEKLVANSPEEAHHLRQLAGLLYYDKGFYLFQLNRYAEAQMAIELAKVHEIDAFRKKRGSPVSAHNLYLTYQLLELTLKAQKKNEEAAKVIVERNQLWWEQAKSLAKTYQTEEVQTRFAEILAFFEFSLTHKERLLRADDIRNDPEFDGLRKRPEFEKLLK